MALVLDRLPELPAAPSLPALDPREGMLAQAAWGLAGVTVGTDGALAVDRRTADPEAPLGDPCLGGAPFTTLRAFLHAVAGRTGPVKVQLTGPVTLGWALRAAGLAGDVAFAMAATAVRHRARHLMEAVGRAAPAAPVVAFVDEPGLVGAAPGALPDDLGLSVEAVIDLVSGALAALEPHAVTGLHCCGPTDWRALIQAGPQILSLPVDEVAVPDAATLAGFVEGGGWVAWGAVPTDGPRGEGPTRLWRVLSTRWCELVEAGCDPVRVRRQALVTPACGLALHGVEQAGTVLDLTRWVADHLHDQVLSTRLSVGA